MKESTMQLSRRGFLTAAPGACAAAGILGSLSLNHASASGGDPGPDSVWPEFPRQKTEWVREMVGVCHRDVDRARALLDEHPALVNATWDWGFGDWETALGAAAHTGRRNIAELLLERGARLDIFAAAMLGQTDAVKAMIAAAPGIQRNPGPHGITLLAHASAGGEAARQTLAYLEGLGDADVKPKTEPLTDAQKQAYVGRFESSALGKGTVEIKTNKNGDLTIVVNGQADRILRHVGNHAFFPAGAPAVRVTFTGTGSGMNSLEIVDHVTVLTAARISSGASNQSQGGDKP
jgi:hypothetical protein